MANMVDSSAVNLAASIMAGAAAIKPPLQTRWTDDTIFSERQ
jgi:hypothetical protein